MVFSKETITHSTLNVNQDPREWLAETFLLLAAHFERWEGRKPTVAEVEKWIASALADREELIFSDATGVSVSECKLKTKKRPKKSMWKPGDVYAIPLPDKKGFGYAMVVKGDGPTDELYLEYYRLFTKKPLEIAEFKKRDKKVFFTACTEPAALAGERWKKIGRVPFDESSYQLPDFYGYDETFFGASRLWYISRGAANNPAARVYGVSQEEAEAVINPDGLFEAEKIEGWLAKLKEKMEEE
jgi:hypothetical protein